MQENPGDMEGKGSQRLASLDAFRGFVILTMVFVNYLPGMPGVPSWLLHVEAGVDGYTLTDVVFPGFLFIVGVAIPLALAKRLGQGSASLPTLSHILVRSLALIFLGVVMVSSESYATGKTPFSREIWSMLFFIAVILLWNRCGDSSGSSKWPLYFKALGLAMMIGLLSVFRSFNGEGEVIWLQTSWWGILGIIGWAYLFCCLYYLLLRGNPTLLMGLLGFLLAVYIGDRHGLFNFLGPVRDFVNVGTLLGTHPAIVLAGVLVGTVFARKESITDSKRIRFMLLFGLGLYFAGTLVRPLHGISKIAATESYALVTSGICCLLFLATFVLMDVLRIRRWAFFLQPVGTNPLLAYILPSILGGLMALTGSFGIFWPFWSTGGLAGTLNATVMTLIVLLVTWFLTRIHIILKL